MHHLQFLDAARDRTLALQGSYDPALVTLSILVASLAAYAAFTIQETDFTLPPHHFTSKALTWHDVVVMQRIFTDVAAP